MGSLGQLNTSHFAALIRKYGVVPASWYQRIGKCPRPHNNVFTGFSPDNTCPLCGGTGEIFRSMPLPLDSPRTSGKVLANVANLRKDKAAVELVAGDMLLSYIETDYPFAEGDKLLLRQRVADHSEELERGGSSGDRLRFSPVTQITAVYIGSGELPRNSYTLSADGAQVLFGGAGGPVSPAITVAPGTPYTIRYRYRPSFLIVAGSFTRRPEATNGDLFPTDCVLRVYNQSPTDAKAGSL